MRLTGSILKLNLINPFRCDRSKSNDCDFVVFAGFVWSQFCPISKTNTPLQSYCNTLNEDGLFAKIQQEMTLWR